MKTEQQQRLALVEQVASGIAHDLNNQMMLILNHVQFVLDQVPEQQAIHQDLCDVRRAAERCTEMIGSLLSFGNPAPARLLPTDLSALLAETGRLLRQSIPSKIDLVIATDPNLGEIDADATQIQQVITNLAMNARDAMPNGGRMLIQARNAGKQVVLIVGDTGCGMTREIQDHIFEPYFTTKQERGGTGLGLVMVSSIVRKHSAQLTVESRPGEGACFRIVFPCPRME